MFDKNQVRCDLLASIVVFLVALPLCMGIALASGVPVATGLITGIVGGLIVGSLSGCPLQVSGPAAGLTVIVYEIVVRYGLEALGTIVLIAGFLQLTTGILRLGQWFRAVSPAVVRGMLTGIGILIMASQIHVMVDDRPKGSGLENLMTIPSAIAKGLSWPKLGSEPQRRYVATATREVGELHRRQAALAEQVLERLPDHASPEQLAKEPADQVAAEVRSLQHLIPAQSTLCEDLARRSQELETHYQQQPDGARSRRILTAIPDARTHCQNALKDLQQGHAHEAIVSQREASASLERLSQSLKYHYLAAQLGLLTIVTVLAWKAFAPAAWHFIPGPLVAVTLATSVAAILNLPVLYVEIPARLWNEIRLPTWAILQDLPWGGILQSAVAVAIVASAETLLSATAVDRLHQGPRTQYDKELLAQGVGNMVSGALGALPVTGVIVRSNANVQSGAKSRWSAIFHGIWLLVFVVGLAPLLRMIPTSSLAAILVYTGYKLIDPKTIKELRPYGWGEIVIFAATVITIVTTDLLTGVVVGVVLSAIKILYRFSHLESRLSVSPDRRTATLSLAGSATFLRLPALAAELEKVPVHSELHVDFLHLGYIDHACLDLLMNWAKQHESTGGRLVIDWDSLNARFHHAEHRVAQAAPRVVASPSQRKAATGAASH